MVKTLDKSCHGAQRLQRYHQCKLGTVPVGVSVTERKLSMQAYASEQCLPVGVTREGKLAKPPHT